MIESYDELVAEAMTDPVIARAVRDNEVRRKLAETFNKLVESHGLDLVTFAQRTHISVTQAKRLLQIEQGGQLYFTTIARACDAFGMDLTLTPAR